MSNGQKNISTEYFDVQYGLASAQLTTGKTIVTTTQAVYHGISVVAGTTARADVTIYDSISDSSGNVVDVFIVKSSGNVWIDRYIPVHAKKGLVVSITGVDAKGTIWFGPKG